jgi:hypothetical protein
LTTEFKNILLKIKKKNIVKKDFIIERILLRLFKEILIFSYKNKKYDLYLLNLASIDILGFKPGFGLIDILLNFEKKFLFENFCRFEKFENFHLDDKYISYFFDNFVNENGLTLQNTNNFYSDINLNLFPTQRTFKWMFFKYFILFLTLFILFFFRFFLNKKYLFQ